MSSNAPEQEKPSLDEVLAYARFMADSFIEKKASDLAFEHREEIQQDAAVRAIEVYPTIESSLGWKSYIYNHARGAVLDYKKFGKAFHEQRWTIKKSKDNGNPFLKIFERVTSTAGSDEDFDIDLHLGQSGVFSQQEAFKVEIRWDLVSRMASADTAIHAFAKMILGFEQVEISEIFGVDRRQIKNLLSEFVERFDDPDLIDDTWTLQTIYAFDLCHVMKVPDVDQTTVEGYLVGWNLVPVDLDAEVPQTIIKGVQLSLFDRGTVGKSAR